MVEERKPNKVTIHSYDHAGKLLTTKENDIVTVSNTYNAHQQLSQTADALNHKTKYTYDPFNRVIEENKEGYITKKQYDEVNQLIRVAENTYKVTMYTYDVLGQEVKQEQNEKTIQASVYDPMGNVIEKTENGLTKQMSYDEMNELKQSTKWNKNGVVKTTYNYDLYGNKTEKSSDGAFKRYHYNTNGELSNIYTEEGNTDISYDENGNMRDILYADGANEHYTYDEFGQLTKVTNSKYEEYTMAYDAQGDRISVGKWIQY